MDRSHVRAYFLAIVTALLSVLALYMFKRFLITLGLAAIFAVIFDPIARRLVEKTKLHRSVASILTLIIGFICVAIPLSFLFVQLLREVETVYASISQPGSIAHAQQALTSLGNSLNGTVPGASTYFASLSANLSVYVKSVLGYALAHAAVVFSGTIVFIVQLFIFIITLYYLLKERSRLTTGIAKYSPLSEIETRTLISRMVITINSVVKGSLVISLIQGVLTAVGFLIFGIPNPVLWGTVAVVSSLIPSVGTAIIFVPGVLYLFFVGHTGHAVGLALYAIFGVGIVDNLLRPYLMSGKVSIHPLLILLSVLGGVTVFGPAGLFLGPLVISLLLGLLSFYNVSENKAA